MSQANHSLMKEDQAGFLLAAYGGFIVFPIFFWWDKPSVHLSRIYPSRWTIFCKTPTDAQIILPFFSPYPPPSSLFFFTFPFFFFGQMDNSNCGETFKLLSNTKCILLHISCQFILFTDLWPPSPFSPPPWWTFSATLGRRPFAILAARD